MSEKTSLPTEVKSLKCYCGFACETERELRDHIIETHGARDGDWKGWVSK